MKNDEVLLMWWFILRFPCTVTLENRSAMPGEEILLRGLYELRSGNTRYDISRIFDRDGSAQSRAFTYFIDYCSSNFKHLLQDNLAWWNENLFWERSAAAVESRMNDSVRGVHFPNKNLVSHFIDCNCLPTSRCGGGPTEDGANSGAFILFYSFALKL